MLAKTQSDNKYSQIQVDKFIYINNYYDYLGDEGSVLWEVDATSQTAWGCFSHERNTQSPQQARLSYNIPTTGGDEYRRVRAYPAMALGSLNGRDSSFGVEAKTGCGQTPVLAELGRCDSAIYDLRQTQIHTSLPLPYLDINHIGIKFKHTLESSASEKAVDNIFLDSVFHYIGDSSTWPDNFNENWGDINKINGNKTSAWNLNVWFQHDQHPDGNSTRLWSGGSVFLDNLVLPSGTSVSINCKHERQPTKYNENCNGGFFYIGVFVEDYVDEKDYNLIYSELVHYIGSQEFKNVVLGDVHCSKLWNDLGRPPFIVDEPHNFILDGIALGKEVWFSPNQTYTASLFQNVSFNINGTIYDYYGQSTPENPSSGQKPVSKISQDTIYKFKLYTEQSFNIKPQDINSVASTFKSITNESDPTVTEETFLDKGIRIKGINEGRNILRLIDSEDNAYFIELTVIKLGTDIVFDKDSIKVELISDAQNNLKKIVNNNDQAIDVQINFAKNNIEIRETILPQQELVIDVSGLDLDNISLHMQLLENN
jgi:hypothetical protein